MAKRNREQAVREKAGEAAGEEVRGREKAPGRGRGGPASAPPARRPVSASPARRPVLMRGKMKWFNEEKDHGYIETEEGERS